VQNELGSEQLQGRLGRGTRLHLQAERHLPTQVKGVEAVPANVLKPKVVRFEYGFLASQRGELFKDEEFAGLYSRDWGRPSVPPSL